MQRSRIVVSLVEVLALVALAVLALVQWNSARKAGEDLAAATIRIAELERVSARKAPAPVVSASDPAAPTAGAEREANSGPPQRDRGGRRWERMADFANDPEIAPLVLKQRQRQMANRYAALIAKLGLTGEQAARLASMLAEREMSEADARRLARMQGLGRDEARTLAEEAGAEAAEALKALLGSAGYAQLEEYDRTYGERSTVNSLAQQLAQTGTPLSATQQERLIGVMAENSTVSAGADAPPGGGPLGLGAFAYFRPDSSPAEVEDALVRKAAADAAALKAASAFLTPAQLEALRGSQEAAMDDLRLAALRMDRFRAIRDGR